MWLCQEVSCVCLRYHLDQSPGLLFQLKFFKNLSMKGSNLRCCIKVLIVSGKKNPTFVDQSHAFLAIEQRLLLYICCLWAN